MIKNLVYGLAAVVLASVFGYQVSAQMTTIPPLSGFIGIACTYQSNEANAAITTGRLGFAQCDNRGYLKVTPSGGGASGAVTIADGADVTFGAQADAACGTDTGTCTFMALFKRSLQTLTTIATSLSSAIPSCGSTPCTTTIGNVGYSAQAARLTVTPVAFSSPGDNTVIARVTGTIKVYQVVVSCSASTTITAKNGASISLGGPMPLTSVFLPFNGEPYYTTTSTNHFILNVSPSGVNCGGNAWYLDN